MASKFNENGIITGIADSFCLSCQKYLKPKDISEHISGSAHQKIFQSTNYVDKYTEDRIRKVKLGYYCEICNKMIQTLAKTGIHVNEVSHVNNKNVQQLKESDAGVVAFNDILIEKNAWHGLADGSCLICSEDYSDEDDHKSGPTHILKLIQSKFELYKNKYVYRKIDGDSINCLICNTIISEQSKETHVNESEHKNNYIKCQNDKKSKIETTNSNVNPENGLERKTDSDKVTHKPPESKPDKNSNIEMSRNNAKNYNDFEENCTSEVDITKSTESKKGLLKTEAEDNLNSETQIVVCKKEEVEQMENEDDDKIIAPDEALQKAKEFAKQNNLKYKRNSTYCKVCDVRISSTLKMMKEHVAETIHKEKAANKTSRNMNKIPMTDFVNRHVSIKNFMCHDVVINDEICVDVLSFFMLSRTRGQLRCQSCEVSIGLDEADLHKNTFRHNIAMGITPVITDFKTEFVREVRPRVYHCGYCNFIEAGLENMKNHLKSINHYQNKSAAQRRLASHLPDIMNHREERQMFNFMRMFFS